MERSGLHHVATPHRDLAMKSTVYRRTSFWWFPFLFVFFWVIPKGKVTEGRWSCAVKILRLLHPFFWWVSASARVSCICVASVLSDVAREVLKQVHGHCLESEIMHAFWPCHCCMLLVLKPRMQFGAGQTKNFAYVELIQDWYYTQFGSQWENWLVGRDWIMKWNLCSGFFTAVRKAKLPQPW